MSIIGLGSISTLLILLMTEVMFAQFLTNMLIGNINDNLTLLIIIIGLLLMTVTISAIISYVITTDIAVKTIRNTIFMSLMCLIIFLFAICNITLFLNYRHVYDNLRGLDVFFVFPEVLVLFSIYVLNDVFSLFVIVIIIYYLMFIFFLRWL